MIGTITTKAITLKKFLNIVATTSTTVGVNDTTVNLFSTSLKIATPILTNIIVTKATLTTMVNKVSNTTSSNIPRIQRLADTTHSVNDDVSRIDSACRSALSGVRTATDITSRCVDGLRTVRTTAGNGATKGTRCRSALTHLSTLIPDLTSSVSLRASSVGNNARTLHRRTGTCTSSMGTRTQRRCLGKVCRRCGSILIRDTTGRTGLTTTRTGIRGAGTNVSTACDGLLSALNVASRRFGSACNAIRSVP